MAQRKKPRPEEEHHETGEVLTDPHAAREAGYSPIEHMQQPAAGANKADDACCEHEHGKAHEESWPLNPVAAQAPAGAFAGFLNEELIMEALNEVKDPEIHQSIVGLGLVYGVDIGEGNAVKVRMTLTTPMCPYGPQLIDASRRACMGVPGVASAQIELVWQPPWDPRTMATEEVKDALGIW